MATTEQIIEHLRKLRTYTARPECDSDGIPHYVDSGNIDDAYGIGETDGGINLAKALIKSLDKGKLLRTSTAGLRRRRRRRRRRRVALENSERHTQQEREMPTKKPAPKKSAPRNYHTSSCAPIRRESISAS